jgi:hypothetical protein
MKLCSWLQMFCVCGQELCNCTMTDQSYSYCDIYLAFFVIQYYVSGLLVTTSPATVQSDTEVLLLVTSVMLGRFNGPNILLEVDQYTLMWNVAVGLSILYIVSQQILLKQFSHHNEGKVCFPRYIYLHLCFSIILTIKTLWM